MILLYPLLILLSPVSTTPNAGHFDLTEFRRVSYDAKIGDDFLWFAPELDIRKVSAENIDHLEKQIAERIPKKSQENYVFVTSKGGQKFACSLPDVEELKKPDAPRSSKNPKIYGDALAASFYIDKCIRLRGNNWWAYILCRGQTVEQVHGEPEQEGYAKNILGIFDGTFTMPPYHESTEDRLLYVEESYSSGTFCDLNDNREPRRTTVRYECDAQLSTNEAYVHSVVEERPCQYLMTVKVGTLCHFPEFLPVSQANTNDIGCQPYLSLEDIKGLLRKQLEEKEKQAVLEKEAIEARHYYKVTADRFTAMMKGKRSMNGFDTVKIDLAEMDYRAGHFNLMMINMKLIKETITKTKMDAIWTLLETSDLSDYLLYIDYDDITQENNGHLWYYFHEPTWPKSQFPKDINAAAMESKYIDEVRMNLRTRKYKYEGIDPLVNSLADTVMTGYIDLKYQMLISGDAIFKEMAHHYYLREKEYEDGSWRFYVYNMLRTRKSVVHELLEIYSWPEDDGPVDPMGGYGKHLVSLLFTELELHLSLIERKDSYVQNKLPNSIKREVIYKTVTFEPATGEIKKKFVWQISVPNQKETLRHLEMVYEDLLTPVYQLFSIAYFQAKLPTYFSAYPRSMVHLKNVRSDDYRFHMNLARDLIDLSRMLAIATLTKLKHIVRIQQGSDKAYESEQFFEDWESLQKIYEREWKEPYVERVDFAFVNVFAKEGPRLVQESIQREWNRIKMQWQNKFWLEDLKYRKQAKALHNLMLGALEMAGGSGTLQTLGGTSSRKKSEASAANKKREDDYILWQTIQDIFENMKEGTRESLIEELTLDLPEDSFLETGDMKEVFSLLEKAGMLNKDDMSIKLVDSDGHELSNEELETLTKNFLDEMDSQANFKENEKAYSSKFSTNSEDEEEDDDE
ncbi:unnamed protein product [Caenorhabditis sp. 36 PRJEB53466]|nr:unnamed protein product [Caenorhabditis sp. 36 PRJEB53466]